MKLKNLLLLCTVLTLAISSCKKEVGPTGPAGADGNANVKSITFNNPITADSYWNDTIKGVNYQSLASSLILTYIEDDGCAPNWYSVPGLGCGANYNARFYTTRGFPDTTMTYGNLELRTPDGTGYVNATISKLRIIVAPASTVIVGGKKEMDFSDYRFACRYFGIKE